MAYNHIVLVFDKPINDNISIDTLNIKISMLEKIVHYATPIKRTLNVIAAHIPEVSYVEGVSNKRQLLIELNEALNNCSDTITVEYTSGIFGQHMNAVEPFTAAFVPTAMPNRPEPASIDNIRILSKVTNLCTYIHKSSYVCKFSNKAELKDLYTIGGNISLNYIGQILP